MSPRRAVGAFLRFAVFALLVGVVLSVVLPGGPLDLEVPGGGPDRPDDGAVAPSGDAGGTATATPPPRPLGESPWEEAVLTVAVRNRADPSRNVTGPVAEALDYWADNAGYADYPAEFHLRSDAADPDVVVWYNDSIDCEDHGDAIGCAPLLEVGTRVDAPVHVQIRYDQAHNRRQVRNTAIHEFGHVLGVTHCEEPHWVMSSACPEPIPDAPNANERHLAWRDGTIAVYVDESNVSGNDHSGTRDQVGHALAYFASGDAEGFPANVTFVRVEDRYEADVTVAFRSGLTCGDDAVVCTEHRGRDFDGDGQLEYHTGGTVLIDADSDVDARGWYAGWALAKILSPGHVPTVFEDASYRDRRSEWWE